MTIRTRTREKLSPIGYTIQDANYPWTNIVESGTTELLQETIVDNILPGNGHDMTVTKRSQPGIPFWNGQRYDGSIMRIKVNAFTPRLRDLQYNLSHNSIAGEPTPGQATVSLLKGTNPSRELINLPVFILELKKLPQLLLKRTRDLGEDIARGRLSLEYGWKPFVKDLVKFVDVQAEIENRIREINNLQRSGLRRKRTIFQGTGISSIPDDGLSTTNGFNLRARLETHTQLTVSGFCVWKPTANSFGIRPSGFDINLAAMQAVLSVYPDPSVIYEYIPFSWLLDWCSNVGDYLHASRNIVGAEPTKVQIMYHRETQQKVQITGSGANFSSYTPSGPLGFTRNLETKQRIRMNSWSAEAQMPFLSGRQVMILGDIVRSQFGPKARAR